MKIRTDPVWFMQTAFDIELDIWQVEAFEAMADVIRHYYGYPTKINHPKPETNDKPRQKFTIRAMHGPGKTFFAAAAIVWFHICFKALSPATAPTIKQLKTRLWPRIRLIKNLADPFWQQCMEIRSTDAIFYKDPDWKCTAETGATPENMQGYHDEFMLIVCDEASGIDEEMFPVIEGALSTGRIVILLLIGNPTKLIGTFADSHLKPKVSKYYHQLHVDINKTTRVSRQWIEEMREKYGVDSPVYKVRCLGEFAEEDENQLISLEWLMESRQKPCIPDGSIPRQRLSIDCSDGGGNFTVITHAIKYQSFTFFKKQHKYSFPAGRAVTMTVNEIERLWKVNKFNKENGDDVVVDSLGVGAGVCSGCIEKGLPTVRYMGGASSDNKDEWRNRRVQSYMVLRDDYRNGVIVTAEDYVDEDDWDDHDAQLCSVKRKPGMEKIEDLLTKKEMVDQGIISPDRADSEAMIFATQAPQLIPGASDFIILGQQMETASYDGSLSSDF
jgi:hypothetical protein